VIQDIIFCTGGTHSSAKIAGNFQRIVLGLSGDFLHFYENFLSFLHQNVYPQFEIKQIFSQSVKLYQGTAIEHARAD
jgi:hypothetical protein